MWILALKMADTGRGVKDKAKVVVNVGRHSLCPHVTIVLLIHALHRLSFGVCCRRGNKGKDIHNISVKHERKKLRVHNLQFIVVQPLQNAFPPRHTS